MVDFKPGELFAYVRDYDDGLQAIELGQVARKVSDDTYACYYSTGDTAARTNVRNMRKFANSGWSHVERTGEDDSCEWVLEHSGTLFDKWRCSKCGFLFVEPRCVQGYMDLVPAFCPSCGRWVR